MQSKRNAILNTSVPPIHAALFSRDINLRGQKIYFFRIFKSNDNSNNDQKNYSVCFLVGYDCSAMFKHVRFMKTWLKISLRINYLKKININDENEAGLANIPSDEDNEFVSIRKKRLIVLNYSTDSDTE